MVLYIYFIWSKGETLVVKSEERGLCGKNKKCGYTFQYMTLWIIFLIPFPFIEYKFYELETEYKDNRLLFVQNELDKNDITPEQYI